MPKLPRLSGKALLRIILKRGFVIDRQSGSHIIVEHGTRKELTTTIPVHTNEDLPIGTLKKIMRDLELIADDLQMKRRT